MYNKNITTPKFSSGVFGYVVYVKKGIFVYREKNNEKTIVMKRIVFLLVAVMCSLMAAGQENPTGLAAQQKQLPVNPTITFLGVPVDGTKSDVINALTSRGFAYDLDEEGMLGEFEGENVFLHISENKAGKVYQIMVYFHTKESAKENIEVYNKLVNRFNADSTNYWSFYEEELIPENVNLDSLIKEEEGEIWAEYLLTQQLDTAAYLQNTFAALLSKFTPEQIKNPTEEQRSEMVAIMQQEISKLHSGRVFIGLFKDEEEKGKYNVILYIYNQKNEDPEEESN